MTVSHSDWAAVTDIPSGSAGAMIGALVMVMTGFGLGWINIAADWSRYQHRDASGASIVGWNTLGGALAPALLVCYGLAIAGRLGDILHPDPTQARCVDEYLASRQEQQLAVRRRVPTLSVDRTNLVGRHLFTTE